MTPIWTPLQVDEVALLTDPDELAHRWFGERAHDGVAR